MGDPFYELPDDSDRLPIDDDWKEYVEHRDEKRQDQLLRHAGYTEGCVICHEKAGQSIYGGKCQRCFEAQREERDAA